MKLTQRLPDDDLSDFLRWFLAERAELGTVPFEGEVRMVGPITSMLVLRRPPFQVQLFAGPGGLIIPEHRHPNVDSYEVYVGGDIHFSKHGRIRRPPEGYVGALRLRPRDLHGGYAGPSGGMFMSVQQWLNGVPPSCVTEDYEGTPLLAADLTLRDAASKTFA